MKKIYAILILLISSCTLKTADDIDDWSFEMIPELRIEEATSLPTDNLEEVVKRHQLEILKLLLEKEYESVLKIVNEHLEAIPEETWKLFLENDQLIGRQWSDLSFEDANKIAKPFSEALNKDDINKAFNKEVKKYSLKPAHGMLIEIIMKNRFEKDDNNNIENFIKTLARYTTDELLFNIMKQYFASKVDASEEPLSIKDIQNIAKQLKIKEKFEIAKIEDAQDKINEKWD